jgi:iron complex outermembrane recepter protein
MAATRILLAGGCAAALLSSSGAWAQDTGIETVVVTAQKRTEDIQSIPITVQAFSAKTISDLGIKASTDLSQFTPNLDIALPAGAGNQPIISIRGVGLNDYDTNNAGPNGVYMDEVYLSSPASQTFQAFDLERIEVLKGPQGTLYGRNTSGGAINFISAKPTDEFTGNFHAEYGSFDTFQLEGAVGGPIAEGLDFRVSAVHNGSGGYTFNALTGGRENGSNNYAGRVQLQWKPTEDLTFLLNVHGGIVANRPAEYRHLGGYDPATFDFCAPARVYSNTSDCVDLFGYGTPSKFYGGAYNRQKHLNVNSLGASLRTDYVIGDDITLTSITAFEHSDKIHPEDSDASPNRELEINFGVLSNTFTQELRASQSTDDYNWVIGLYYLSESLHQDQPLYVLLDADNFFGGPGAGDGVAQIAYDQSRQVTSSYAAYGQGTYNVTDALKLTLGGRVTAESKSFHYRAGFTLQDGGMDHFDPVTPILPPPGGSFDRSLSNTSANWRVAANYNVTTDIMAYASAATGFKSGGFNGSFLSTDPVQINAQLAPIKPENVTAYEVGVKSTFFDDRLLFNAALFYNDYRNLQIFVLAPVPGTVLATNLLSNARSAHMMGADIQTVAKPFENLTVSAQLGLLQAKIDSNELLGVSVYTGLPIFDHAHQLPLAPHVSFSALADYKFALFDGTVDLQLGASYKSRQMFDVANSPYLTQRPYWLENLRVAYSFDDDKWEAAAYVRNLSGQKYYLDVFDLSFLGFYQGIMGQPRTVGAELNYKF